jgi:cytochrome c oxidase assembly protein subunit 11
MSEPQTPHSPPSDARAARTRRGNLQLLGKLGVVCVAMFAFGYALVPIYRAICDALGINVLAAREQAKSRDLKNTQIDLSRTITVEFDANARGPWKFRPKTNILQVHPGELHTVVYEIWNPNERKMLAQSIPSYAPKNSAAHFNKLECFCFKEQTLAAGEKREFPVAFIIDPKLPKDVSTITLSYTFFEVGAATPKAPEQGNISGKVTSVDRSREES